MLIPDGYRRMIGHPLTSQVKLKEARYSAMPHRIQKVLETNPSRLELGKKFDLDIIKSKSSYFDDRVLSIHVDLYDHATQRAYMIEKPIDF